MLKKFFIFHLLFINNCFFGAEINSPSEHFINLASGKYDQEYDKFNRDNFFKTYNEIIIIMQCAVLTLSHQTNEYEKYYLKIEKLDERVHPEIKAIKLYRYLYELGKKINYSNAINIVLQAIAIETLNYKYSLLKNKSKHKPKKSAEFESEMLEIISKL